MLPYVLYEISLFSEGDNRREAETDLSWMLEALCQRDQDYLKQHPLTPSLYKSGVVYDRPAQFNGECEEASILRWALGDRVKDPKVAGVLATVQAVFGGERFCDIGVIIDKGKIDCDGLASWRAAELRQAGIPASPYLKGRPRPGGGWIYHAFVRWPDGSMEDPSLLLGMGGEDRKADRDEQIRANQERIDNMRKNGKGVRKGDIAQAVAVVEGLVLGGRGGGGGGGHGRGGGGGRGFGGRGFGGLYVDDDPFLYLLEDQPVMDQGTIEKALQAVLDKGKKAA